MTHFNKQARTVLAAKKPHCAAAAELTSVQEARRLNVSDVFTAAAAKLQQSKETWKKRFYVIPDFYVPPKNK